jgi:hypothetical protein
MGCGDVCLLSTERKRDIKGQTRAMPVHLTVHAVIVSCGACEINRYTGRSFGEGHRYLAGIRGIFSSTIAACHAKVAIMMADCFNSSSLMRSG